MRHFVTHFFLVWEKLSHLDAFNDGCPAKFIRLCAVLDATELVVKFLAPRSGFAVAEGVRLARFGVVDARDGADDGSGAASASLFESGQFFLSDGTTFHLHAQALCNLDEALVGDGRQN